MKIFIHRLFSLILLITLTIQFSNKTQAQNKLMGEIIITGASANDFVTINKEKIVSGRTIISPADILTSAGASAKIVLPKTGMILVSPNTELKLSFVNGGISGDLLKGEVIFNTEPGTMLNIFTPDGTTTLADKSKQNIVKLTVENGAARINTLVGTAVFNTVEVKAGEYYPIRTDNNDSSVSNKSSKGNTGIILLALIGAAAAVLGLVVGGGNDNSSPASPVR